LPETLEFPPMIRPSALRTVLAVTGICVISLTLAMLAAGCGGDDKKGTSEEAQALRIEQFQSDVRFFCITGKNDLAGAADPLGTVITAVDNLIKIYRDDPKATYELARIDKRGDKLGVRAVPIGDLLEESAATLKKGCGRYGRDQAARLDSTVKA
jgi:hypothetical protein